MEQLLKLPTCTTEKSTSLRFVYDKINVNIRGLASLGIKFSDLCNNDKVASKLCLRLACDINKEVWEI